MNGKPLNNGCKRGGIEGKPLDYFLDVMKAATYYLLSIHWVSYYLVKGINYKYIVEGIVQKLFLHRKSTRRTILFIFVGFSKHIKTKGFSLKINHVEMVVIGTSFSLMFYFRLLRRQPFNRTRKKSNNIQLRKNVC